MIVIPRYLVDRISSKFADRESNYNSFACYEDSRDDYSSSSSMKPILTLYRSESGINRLRRTSTDGTPVMATQCSYSM